MIGAILLVVMTGMAVYMYRDYRDNLEDTLEEMVKPMSLLPGMEPQSSETGRPARPADRPRKKVAIEKTGRRIS